jgi:hypothetical protein
LRTLILAAALVAGTSAVHADSTWTFTYTGATSTEAPFPLPSISGSFTANDLDGNGRIDRSEVISLDFFNYQVWPATDIDTPSGTAGQSELTSFSYDIGSRALGFDAKAGAWHDAWIKTGDQLLYATGIGQFAFDLSKAQLTVDGPGRVQLQSAVAAVPEPGSWLLMCAGLGALLLAAARRRAACAGAAPER